MQKLKRHKIALTLIIIYIAIFAAFAFYAFTCDSDWCGLAVLLPLLPWILVASQMPIFENSGPVLLILCLILNIGSLLLIGFVIEWVINSLKKPAQNDS